MGKLYAFQELEDVRQHLVSGEESPTVIKARKGDERRVLHILGARLSR